MPEALRHLDPNFFSVNPRESLESRDNVVLITKPEQRVVTIYKNTAQVSDFFSAKITADKTHLIYEGILPTLDPDSPFIYFDQSEGIVLSQSVSKKQFSLQNYYKSLIGKNIKVYDDQGNITEGKLLDLGKEVLTLYTTTTATPMLKFIKQESIACAVTDDLFEVVNQKSFFKAIYQTEYAPENLSGQIISQDAGFAWDAVYRLVIEEKEDGELRGEWRADANISNRTKVDLKDLVVKVVSGALCRGKGTYQPHFPAFEAKALPAMSQNAIQHQAIDQKWEDLKAYLIPYKVDLKVGETLSTCLFQPKSIKLDKGHVLHTYEYQTGESHPHVCYHIENSEENHLGQAFPDGLVQVFRKNEGAIDLIGEHNLQQTPRGKDIELITSECFDLIIKKSVDTKNQKDENHKLIFQENLVTLELTNGSDRDKKIYLHEHLSKDYTLLDAGHKIESRDSDEIVFCVTVPKNTTAKNPMRISYQYRKDFMR